jgi:hypothetical protein
MVASLELSMVERLVDASEFLKDVEMGEMLELKQVDLMVKNSVDL